MTLECFANIYWSKPLAPHKALSSATSLLLNSVLIYFSFQIIYKPLIFFFFSSSCSTVMSTSFLLDNLTPSFLLNNPVIQNTLKFFEKRLLRDVEEKSLWRLL